MSVESKIKTIASQMGVSYNDALSFISCVSMWMSKGLSFGAAVVRHGQVMSEGCALAIKKVEG